MNSHLTASPETLPAFRGLTGQLATAVSVVIAYSHGEPFGTTAGSVVALSSDPPMLGVSFRIGSRMDNILRDTDRFTVNILSEHNSPIATRFSIRDRAAGWEAFTGIRLERREPAPPILSDALAWADCEVTTTIETGDHRLYVGTVIAMERRDSTAPLVYYRGRYRGLGSAIAPPAWNHAESFDLASSW